MQKNTNDEIGILLTREMLTMMFDKNLKSEQKVHIFCAVVGDEKIKDVVLASYANALKIGYIHANSARVASIQARRERQKEYQRNLRASTETKVDVRALPIKGICEGICSIPLPPKGGKGEKSPTTISADDLLKEARPFDDQTWASEIASEIVEWYPHEVNPSGLKKILIAKSKKNLRRALEDGLDAWRKSGSWDEERFVPQDIVKWIKLERFLDQPPEKKISAARADGGRALAAPSSDATMRMIQSGEEEE